MIMDSSAGRTNTREFVTPEVTVAHPHVYEKAHQEDDASKLDDSRTNARAGATSNGASVTVILRRI